MKDRADPLATVKAGLQGSNKEPVPLKSVHIRGIMLDMVAQVSICICGKKKNAVTLACWIKISASNILKY